jgi:hypothetical protein
MSIIDHELNDRDRSELGLSVAVFGALAFGLLLLIPGLGA